VSVERVLGILLGTGLGILQPPTVTRRRRRPASTGMTLGRGGQRALLQLAAVAAAALADTVSQPAAKPTSKPIKIPGASAEPLAASTASPKSRVRTSKPRDAEADALLIVRAMIAAARADGAFDPTEQQTIAKALDEAGLDHAERELVLGDLARPMDLAALAAGLDDPMVAAQAYAACVSAVGEASDPERMFLAELAKRTGLDSRATAAIEAGVLRHA